MATETEHPEKYEWWINELKSLGIELNDKDQPNDLNQLENLTDHVKQNLIQKYKSQYR
jgi:hypothetical protein